ncbi:hypothetical protein Tco_0336660 [Tanacetum coccineum]
MIFPGALVDDYFSRSTLCTLYLLLRFQVMETPDSFKRAFSHDDAKDNLQAQIIFIVLAHTKTDRRHRVLKQEHLMLSLKKKELSIKTSTPRTPETGTTCRKDETATSRDSNMDKDETDKTAADPAFWWIPPLSLKMDIRVYNKRTRPRSQLQKRQIITTQGLPATSELSKMYISFSRYNISITTGVGSIFS